MSVLERDQEILNFSLEKAVITTKQSISELSHFVTCHEIDFRGSALSEEQKSVYHKIRQHRYKYYLEKAPHLTQDREIASEINVDSRSIVYALEINNEILLSLRVTPRPFEIESFQLHEFDFNQFYQYAELGRLVSDPSIDQVTTALLARYLLCYTGLQAFERFQFKGFVAICRPFRITYFRKFGLKDQFTFFYQERKLSYHVLSAKMEEILLHTTALQSNEDYLLKRLKNKFCL